MQGDLVVQPAQSTSAGGSVAGLAAAGGVSTIDAAAHAIAQQVKFHRALLAAARQHGSAPEAQAEVARQEAQIARLTAEEKAAQPPEDRLRSLLDRVRHREQTAAAADVKVKELEAQLKAAKEAAVDAHASLDKDRSELTKLQSSMSTPPPAAPVAAAQALATLLAAVQELRSGAEGAQDKLTQASESAQAALNPTGVPMETDGAAAQVSADGAADLANAAAAREALAEKRAAELLVEIDRETEPGSKKARLQEALRQAYGVEPFLATQPA